MYGTCSFLFGGGGWGHTHFLPDSCTLFLPAHQNCIFLYFSSSIRVEIYENLRTNHFDKQKKKWSHLNLFPNSNHILPDFAQILLKFSRILPKYHPILPKLDTLAKIWGALPPPPPPSHLICILSIEIINFYRIYSSWITNSSMVPLA